MREEARSSGSELSESGDWQIVDEANIAVDYSNVHVFLKTLQAWQSSANRQQEAANDANGTSRAAGAASKAGQRQRSMTAGGGSGAATSL